MTLRAHHFVVTLFGGAIILGSLALLTVDPQTAQATCPTGSSVAITYPSSGGTTTPLSGIVALKAQTTPTTASGLTFLAMNPAQQVIGEATQSGTQWSLNWDTRNLPNGPNNLIAIAHFGTATSLDCGSAAIPIAINNLPTQNPALRATVAPATWTGPVGATVPFTLDAVYTDQYGRLSHVSPAGINWSSPLGSAQPVNQYPTVFKASTVGKGPLIANISYNGLSAQGIAQLTVTAPGTTNTTSGTPTPSPAVTQPTTTSGDPVPSPTPFPITQEDATRLAAMPTVFRPAEPTNTAPVVSLPTLGCLEKAVGKVRFAEISSGKSQPTAAERKLASACFSGSERIPGVLAPVAPAHLTEVPKTDDLVTLEGIKNQTITTSDGKKIQGLLLSGKGAPNTSVFIYVFSDPLVLRAQTNGSGVWSYVLENPLKAGKHEVYAVAEKDAGNFVRTSAVPITVAAAAPGASDGSLVIESGLSGLQTGFAAGALVLVLAAIGLLFTILRRRRAPRTNLTADAVPAPTNKPGVSGMIVPGAAESPVASPPEVPNVSVPGAEIVTNSPVTASAPASTAPETPAPATPAPAQVPTDHDPQV